jgi:hypothetical protein
VVDPFFSHLFVDPRLSRPAGRPPVVGRPTANPTRPSNLLASQPLPSGCSPSERSFKPMRSLASQPAPGGQTHHSLPGLAMAGPAMRHTVDGPLLSGKLITSHLEKTTYVHRSHMRPVMDHGEKGSWRGRAAPPNWMHSSVLPSFYNNFLLSAGASAMTTAPCASSLRLWHALKCPGGTRAFFDLPFHERACEPWLRRAPGGQAMHHGTQPPGQLGAALA